MGSRLLLSIHWMLCLCVLWSCSTGREPPPATPTVFIEGTSEFLVGGEEFAPCNRFEFKDGQLSLAADDAISSERIRYQASISNLCVDAYEVSVLQYEHCVLRGTCEPPKITNLGSLDRGDAIGRYWSQRELYADYPVVGVEWSDAQRYCAFRGGRLPTEVEWEYIAKGSQSDRQNTLSPSLMQTLDGTCEGARDELALGNCSATILPVRQSTADDNGFGVFGMHSGVAEWTADEFDVFVGCEPSVDDGVPFDELLCLRENKVYRRPLSVLLSESDDDCISAPLDSGGQTCDGDLRYEGTCIDNFRDCYTVCGNQDAAGQVDGKVCLDRCFSDYESCAQTCLGDEVALTCVRIQDGYNCYPEPICRIRHLRDGTKPHITPTFLRGDRVTYVVKGAHFQTDRACEVRSSKRFGAYKAESLVGFRCVFDTENEVCP